MLWCSVDFVNVICKNTRLVILFDMLLNPYFKMTKSYANIARTTASTSKFVY